MAAGRGLWEQILVLIVIFGGMVVTQDTDLCWAAGGGQNILPVTEFWCSGGLSEFQSVHIGHLKGAELIS